MAKSHLVGRAILITHPEAPGKLLVVEIDIDCPDCGQQTIKVVGHHLKALRNLLMEFIDLHPDLTGDDAGIEVLNRINFSGSSTPDPSRN